MVQATILDLIDRSHLTYRQEGDSNILTRIEKEGLFIWSVFLDMLFDGRMEIRDTEMFSRYYLDKDALENNLRVLEQVMSVKQYVSRKTSNINSLMTAIK